MKRTCQLPFYNEKFHDLNHVKLSSSMKTYLSGKWIWNLFPFMSFHFHTYFETIISTIIYHNVWVEICAVVFCLIIGCHFPNWKQSNILNGIQLNCHILLKCQIKLSFLRLYQSWYMFWLINPERLSLLIFPYI